MENIHYTVRANLIVKVGGSVWSLSQSQHLFVFSFLLSYCDKDPTPSRF